MNVQDMFDTIAQKHAKRAADLVDGAAYAYVTQQLEEIKKRGLNPGDYEVVFAGDEFPQYIEDKDGTQLKVTRRIRLERRKDLANLPILGEPTLEDKE
jgi:hypothetical protein